MTTEVHHAVLERVETSSNLLTPEEPLLARYSPHHEFPISTVFSVVIHGLVALIAVLFGAYIWGFEVDRTIPAVDHIEFVSDLAGGGGSGENAGKLDGIAPEELGQFKSVNPPAEGLPKLDFATDVGFLRSPQEIETLRALNNARGSAPEGIVGAKGGKGSGAGGGDGEGFGTKQGSGRGAYAPPPRMERVDRWTVSIPYNDGLEFLNKLANLQAVLAIPEGPEEFRVFDNLAMRPFESAIQSRQQLAKLQRIYWSFTAPDLLTELGATLRLRITPKIAHVFLPQSLEKELLDKELARAKPLTERQLTERKIDTRFRAERQDGKWVVTVLEQGPRKTTR
jgi:hypothetical protein